LRFSPDGQRVYSQSIRNESFVWDVSSGKRLTDVSWESTAEGEKSSETDRWWVAARANRILLVDRKYNQHPEIKSFLASKSRIDSRWQEEMAAAAEEQEDWYAETFHRAWIAKNDPAKADSLNRLRAAFDNLSADFGEPRTDPDPYLAPIVKQMLHIARASAP
jgi:hypothetical protein